MLNRVFLIIFNSNIGFVNTKRFHQQTNSHQGFFAFFQHHPMIGSQVRLALHPVYNEHFSFHALWRNQLYMGWEGCPTQTNNAGFVNLVDNCFAVDGKIRFQIRATVNGFVPLIAFHSNENTLLGVAATIGCKINLANRSGYR